MLLAPCYTGHPTGMSLRSILSPTRITVLDRASSADDLIDSLASLLCESRDGPERDAVAQSLRQRERMGSTAIGHGVALPHGRNAVFDEARAAFVRVNKPVEFEAMDGEDVDLLLALSVPAHFTHQHLQLLAEIAERFADADFRAALRAAPDADSLHDLLAGDVT